MFRHFIKNLTYARQGLGYVYKEEKNFALQTIIAIITMIGGWFFHITPTEWIFITIAIALVLGAEIINTIFEDICDEIEPNHHTVIGRTKDMMAALVLLFSVAAAVIGCIVFIPYIF